MLWQHRHNTVNKIHRCGAFLGFAVDERALMHIMGHIGNVHTDLIVAVRQRAYRKGIIEVFCILGVDGEGGYIAHIAA